MLLRANKYVNILFPSRLYPITDTLISGLPHAEQIERLSQGGARIVQLRDKTSSPREFYEAARSAMEVARRRGVRIVINDRADIALALNADGVHLGQDDLPPEEARRLLGPEAIIGFSTHSVRQASEATKLPVDYLAIGPIFETSTKQNPDPVVGIEGLRRVRNEIGEMTLVAIGGITPENAREVIESGADAVAVIGSILSNPAEISARVRDFEARMYS